MLKKIEELSLEKRAKIYRKCIETVLAKDYVVGCPCVIDDIVFSYDQLISVCYYVIPVYGNSNEQKKFYNKYGMSLIVLDEEVKDKIYVDRLKYIYDFREDNFSKNDKLKEFASNMRIRITDIKSLAREYATSYLRISKKEYDWHIFKRSRDNISAKMTFSMLFDLLLNFDDKDEIIYLIDYSNVEILSSPREKINSYIKQNYSELSEKEKRQIYDTLISKIEIYKESRKEKENLYLKSVKEESLKSARDIMFEFVSNKISYGSIREYCDDNDISYSYFINKLNILEKSENEDDVILYKLCREKIEADRKKGSTYNYSLARIIADYIINGIPTDSGLREFDLIDYYSLTDVNLRNVLTESKQFLSKSEVRKFSAIVSNNERLKKAILTSKNGFNFDIEFDCQKDKNGFPIPGTGRRVTDEEKENIISLFEKYNIPMYLFRIAIERIKKGVPVDDVLADKISIERKGKKLVKKPQ